MARSLTALPKLPTSEDIMKKIRRKAGLPTAERRKKKRLTIAEINMMGDQQLREHLAKIREPADRRTTFTKVMDVIDIPRNIVANIIGSVAGVEKRKLQKGALGLPRVMMSDVLKKAGVKNKVVRGVVGFAGDVLVDPLLYASLGAATGLRIGKGLPRVLKPGTKLLKRTAQAMTTGGRVSAKVAKALGRTPEQLLRVGGKLAAKRGVKTASKQLMARRGGLLTRTLARRARGLGKPTAGSIEAAQGFLKQFGMKGRTILRAPFAAKGLALKRGKQARVFAEMGDPKRIQQMLAQAGKAAEGRALVGAGAKKAAASAAKLAAMKAEEAKAAKAIKQIGGKYRLTPHQAGKLKGEMIAQTPESLAAYRQATSEADDILRQIGQKYRLTPEQAATIKRQVVGKIKPTMGLRQYRRDIKAAAEKLAGEAEVLRKKGTLAGGEARSMMFATEAPEAMRGIVEQAGGTLARSPQELAAMGAGPVTRAKHALIRGKRQLFGGPVTDVAQREAALRRGIELGPREAAAQALGEYRPLVDKLLKKHMPTGLTGARHAAKKRQMLQSLTDLAEAAGKTGGELGYESDRLRRAIEVIRRTPLARDPDTIALVEKLNVQFGAMRSKELLAGMGKGALPGYRPRFETKEFAKFHKPEAPGRIAGTAVQEERVAMREFVAKGKPTQHALTSATKEELAPLRQAGYEAGKSYPISARQWNTGRNPLTGKPLSTKMIGPGTPMPQQFVTDPAEQMARRASSHQWQMGMAEFRDYVMKQGTFQLPQYQAAGIPHLAQPFGAPGSKQGALYRLLGKDLAPGGTPLMMDRPVAEMIDRMNYVVSTPEAVSKLLRGFDTAQGFWKTFALYHPGYVIRNVFQNLFGGTMAGARPLRVAKMSVSSKMRAAVKAAQEGKPIVGSITINGRPVELKVLFAELFKRNHVGTGMTAMLENPTTYGRLRHIIQNKVMRAVFKLNQRVEDGMKAATYVDFLEQGMSARQASMQLAKAMPDLTMLSTFERSTMRRALPFYSWYRRNGALQLFHYLPNYPAWSAAAPKLRNAVQMAMVGDQAVDAQLRPSWQEEAQATQIMGDTEAGSVFLMGSWLPFDDMVAVLGAAASPQDFMREMLERASPAAKFGAEMAVGVDIFRQRPIPKFTPQEFIYNAPKAIIGKSGSPLDNLLGIRPAKEYLRRVWEQPTVAAGITRGLIGGAIQPVSRERGLIAASRQLRDQSQTLRAKLNRAVENRDQQEIQLLTRQLMSVWAEMMERGLPGVPKAAQAMMGKRGIQAAEPALR